jgi:hypothetical protein
MKLKMMLNVGVAAVFLGLSAGAAFADDAAPMADTAPKPMMHHHMHKMHHMHMMHHHMHMMRHHMHMMHHHMHMMHKKMMKDDATMAPDAPK